MNVLDLPLKKKDDLYAAYLSGDSRVSGLFDYDPYDAGSYIDRWKELKERSFPREELYKHLSSYHKKLPTSEKTWMNIEKLKDPDSTVVVTGQQAGLMTGPLYTVHKCLSALLFAEQQEKRIGSPVIPIFWVAGEDHDFDEVNHIHVFEEGEIRKKKFSMNEGKRSVSYIPLPKPKLYEWVDEIIHAFGETEHTQELQKSLRTAIQETETWTEFFSYLMAGLFKELGIVMLDANHPEVRRIESSFFAEMIKDNDALDDAFKSGERNLVSHGYSSPVESEDGNSHLFIDEQDTRVLLFRDGERHFRGKNNECLYTMKELTDLAIHHPDRLSNNVISRPLMQEKLLPTLAFVAGPGEIAYWSMLKPVFHLHSVKMPPVLPRLSILLIDRVTQKLLRDKDIDVEQVLDAKIPVEKEQWLTQQDDPDIDSEFLHTVEAFQREHDRLKNTAKTIDKGLEPLAEKNWRIIEGQLQFLKERMKRSIYEKYETELRKFDYIESHLMPKNQPQERVLNVYEFINQYGEQFITELASNEFSWNGKPKAIFL
ncbi:bacillithiol biosynthesis cysteine-adding enzyme BshC [Pseudalkalibacillus sp. SCS-8]|uniref:bacillithiol biosynthesis cysteine-adding enzyme BshC n=1 Tax=Pseudalkalibacillus nanhaiensis TaxID=3115291 RepID=UPI0032DB7CBF